MVKDRGAAGQKGAEVRQGMLPHLHGRVKFAGIAPKPVPDRTFRQRDGWELTGESIGAGPHAAIDQTGAELAGTLFRSAAPALPHPRFLT
jgi:hypothetical protein